MKKVLSTALAIGLIAGVASTASAAFDSFSITGYYQVEGWFATNMDKATTTPGVNLHAANPATVSEDASSAWWYHEFRMYPVLKVNDSVTMKAELRIINGDWGGTGQAGYGNGQANDTDWDKLYMEYVSPVGMIRMGLIPWGPYGTKFIDTGSRNNGIVWFPNFVPKPLDLTVVYGKLTEGDYDATTPTTETDGDADYYDVRLGYKSDAVSGNIRVGLTDDQTNPDININKWHVGGYANFKLGGNVTSNFEFDKTYGDSETKSTGVTTDYDALAAYVDVTTKVNDVTIGALAWYLSGDKDAANGAGAATQAANVTGDNEMYGHAGQDFNPLLIATGDDFGLLNDETGAGAALGQYDGVVNSFGQQAIGAFASMPLSDKLTGTVVVGSAWADEEADTWDDHYGYEIDLILSYKLLDNLTYTANFGYFDAGDLFDMTSTSTADNAIEDSVVMVNHTLNMQF